MSGVWVRNEKQNEIKLKKIFYINRCLITTDLLTYKKHYNTGAGGGVRSCGLGNESKKKKARSCYI